MRYLNTILVVQKLCQVTPAKLCFKMKDSKLEVLREKANEIMHQINLLEAESWVLEDGINAINEILKNKITIDHNFVEKLMKLIYIDYKPGTDKSELILLNSNVIYMDPSLKPYEAELYTTLAHLLFLLEADPFLFATEKGLLEIKNKAKSRLFKVNRKKQRLLAKYEKYIDKIFEKGF